MPGTLSLSKPCDKCKRNSQTTKITSVELPKSQMLLSEEYQCGLENICGLSIKWEGQVGWHSVQSRSQSPQQAPPPDSSSVLPGLGSRAKHVAPPKMRIGILRLWSGAIQDEFCTITWGEYDSEKDAKQFHCTWDLYFQRYWTQMKKKKLHSKKFQDARY